MDIGSIFVFIALLLIVGLFVSRPLFENRSVAVSQTEQRYSSLMADRDRVLDSIRELDMDNEMGKLPPDLYASQRTELVRQGVEILQQLDDLQAIEPQLEGDRQLGQALAAPVENPSQAETAGMRVDDASSFDHDLENLVSVRRQGHSVKAAGFCPKCGNPVQQHDRFCSRCGATV
jgi:zinc-ribbon domain